MNLRLALLTPTFLGLVACATSPLGRKQLTLIPQGLMDSMGVSSFAQMKNQTPVEADPRSNQYIRCITDPLLAVAKQLHAVRMPGNWEVVVFKDPTANAFALPGGKIGVHTGLLNVAKTDGQLAAVIGHEIGHVIAQHGNERVSQGVAAQVGLTGLDLAFFGNQKDTPEGQRTRALVMGGLGLATQTAVLLPFSRTHESEADLIGLDLMARAGFDPGQSVELWRNMMAAHPGGPPEFLSTHPSGDTRIRNLESKMGEAKQAQASAGARLPCAR